MSEKEDHLDTPEKHEDHTRRPPVYFVEWYGSQRPLNAIKGVDKVCIFNAEDGRKRTKSPDLQCAVGAGDHLTTGGNEDE